MNNPLCAPVVGGLSLEIFVELRLVEHGCMDASHVASRTAALFVMCRRYTIFAVAGYNYSRYTTLHHTTSIFLGADINARFPSASAASRRTAISCGMAQHRRPPGTYAHLNYILGKCETAKCPVRLDISM